MENNSDDYLENQMKMYNGKFLNHITKVSSPLYDALQQKDKQKVCELLTDLFVDNLEIYDKIRNILGFGEEKLNQEEIDKIRINILDLIK